MKQIYSLLIVLLLWTIGSKGQPGSPQYSPTQGGEDISTAFVLVGPLPVSTSGTTAGYLDDYDEDCPNPGSTAPDVVYSYTPLAHDFIDIDLCGSSFDTKVYVYENVVTPGNPFACNDDFYYDPTCGYNTSLIEGLQLFAGYTYYIVIDGSTGSDYGNYVLTIRESTYVPPCTVVCPSGSVTESESCGENTNGGCDMAAGTENWETVPSIGGTFCGTLWAEEGMFDTDWFELILTESSNVVLHADADYQVRYGMLETTTPGSPACSTLTGNMYDTYAGPCLESEFYFGVLDPGTYWFKVELTNHYGLPCDNNYWISFEVTPPPCLIPADLFVSSILPTSAVLNWTEAGISTEWEYQVGPTGFTPAATGTYTNTNATSVFGLTFSTNYDFYVRSDCGAQGFSDWSGPLSFTTPCATSLSVPWSEDFDDMTLIGNNILPDCWMTTAANGSPWSSGDASLVTQHDPCSSPNYVVVNYVMWNEYKHLITPGFSLTAGTSYDFSFNWVGDGYTGWTGDVVVNSFATGMGASVLGEPFVIETVTTSTACAPVTRSFTPASSGTYYFMIRVFNNYLPFSLGFDDFSLAVTPGCQAPSNLAATSITTTGANLAWTPGNTETDWEYVYGTAPLPAPAGSGTATTSNTSNPISGLSANTDYQYYVRAVCGDGFSTWAGPFSFNTPCEAISIFPAQEGFETSWPPECWTDPQTTEYGWDQSTFGSAHSGSEWAYCNLAGSVLISPDFDLPSDALLLFWYRAEDSGDPQDMEIKIGHDVIYQVAGATNTTYQQVQVSLADYTGQAIAVSFIGKTGTGGVDNGICLDDVTIKLTNEWTGNASIAWNNLGNWSLARVPDQFEVVFIPSFPAGGNFPAIFNGVTAECYNLTVAPGATVTVQTGGTLNIKNQ